MAAPHGDGPGVAAPTGDDRGLGTPMDEGRLILDALSGESPIGSAVIDAGLRVVSADAPFAAIDNQTGTDPVGRLLADAQPALAAELEPSLRRVLDEGRPLFGLEHTGRRAGHADEHHWLMSLYPVPGDDVDVAAVGVVAIDTTERRRIDDALRGSERRLRLALDAADMGSFDWDIPAGTVEWDERLQAMFGHAPGTFPGTWDAFMERIHPEDRVYVEASVQAATDAAEPFDVRCRVLEPAGQIHWIAAIGTVLRAADGAPARMVGLAYDITERRASEQRAGFLAEAGVLLAGTLDHQEALRRVAGLAVPLLADWCVIEVADSDGTAHSVAAAHVDPGRVEAALPVLAHHPADPRGEGAASAVLRSGRARLYQEISLEAVAAVARDDEELGLLRSFGLRSAIVAPMVARGRTLGVITLFHAESGRRYDDEDVAFVEELGRRAGIAVDNARLLQSETQARNDAEASQTVLERLLELAPSVQLEQGPEEVAAAVCRAAVETLGADAATVSVVQDDLLRTLARVPPSEHLPPGYLVPLSERPDLQRELLPPWRPVVKSIEELAGTATGQAMAEQLGVGRVLRVPMVHAGQVTGFLTAAWGDSDVRIPPGVRALAQRLTDQAALALEQVERRLAQAEAERMRMALDRLLDLAPGIAATGGEPEVAVAVCEAARETFECSAAVLWERGESRWRPLAAQPVGAAIPEAPASLDESRPIFLVDPDHAATLVVPLARDGGVERALTLLWDDNAPPASPETRALARRFADQALLALEQARVRTVQAEAARLHAQLEANLLPSVEFGPDGPTVVTRYRPGEHRMLLGGDFFDALALPDGSSAFLVGDVSGHGPAAAALGATLRVAWRTLVLQGILDAGLLQGLEAVLERERSSPETFATVACALVPPGGRRLRVMLAGHPPPLVVPAAYPTWTALEPGPPLGASAGLRWKEASRPLPPGSSLLFYTDGLVEGRADRGSVERFGLARVSEWLARPEHGDLPAAALLDRLLDDVRRAHGEELDDDVALMLVSDLDGPPGEPPLRALDLVLPADPRSLGEVRRAIEGLCAALGISRPVAEDVKLATAEACANVVRHAYDPSEPEARRTMEIRAGRAPGGLDVVVRDQGRGLGMRGDSDGAGLGLVLIGRLCAALEVHSAPGRTMVRMHFAVPAAP
jgi:serine phosphatase RsbU (regulator of sigma subunit)/PAS domain-containing protein/anti-sigma regulatory factor (Ser/Thr protein kinase)